MDLNVDLNLRLSNHQSLCKKKKNKTRMITFFFSRQRLNYERLQSLSSTREKKIIIPSTSNVEVAGGKHRERRAQPLFRAPQCRKKTLARCDPINRLHAELSLVPQHKQSLSSPLLSFQARAHCTEQ